jgi:hypothetical protein
MPSALSCLTCMEDVGVGAEPVVPPHAVYRFQSKYPSTCRNCGADTEPGDLVVKMSDDTYWCDDCAGLAS